MISKATDCVVLQQGTYEVVPVLEEAGRMVFI